MGNAREPRRNCGGRSYDSRAKVNDGRGKSDINRPRLPHYQRHTDITSLTTASVSENQVWVQTVSASDPVDTLTYSISGGDDAGFFDIVGSTGVLSFKVAPNFESPQDQGGNNSYLVEVTANDGTTTTSQLVTVAVANVNKRWRYHANQRDRR
ncbi:MAG: cadherin repeat domain-containing protein [Pirellulaceae bacterium]